MRFADSRYLWGLWLIPLLALFYALAYTKRKRDLTKAFDASLIPLLLPHFSWPRKTIKAVLALSAVASMTFAAARPQWGFHWEEVERKGFDLMVAIDVSKSMNAEDVQPNRIQFAKRKVLDLIKMLEGDRVGLVAFSGRAFVQCPLTLDYEAIKLFLDAVDTDLISVPGTNIAEAIRVSVEAFDLGLKRDKAILLITDGEELSGQAISSAAMAKTSGIKIFTLGIGEKAGAPIPQPDGGGFKKDADGNIVLSKLDEESLQKIALETGGSYVRAISSEIDLHQIYTKNMRKYLARKEIESSRQKKWEERFPVFAALAFALLLMELLIPEMKSKKRERELV